MSKAVSIPLREAKNSFTLARSVFAIFVSIPLREAKNVSSYYCRSRFSTFQSLLGRLKTMKLWNGSAFQKIVSIPLREAKNLLPCFFAGANAPKFQSLLGRLKTQSKAKARRRYAKVSIPLREAKNISNFKNDNSKIGVSIPLREAKNGQLNSRAQSASTGFNPS
ncbi:MAG: hypothetical protein PWQ97_257 [Tepidanaerobacteraceae bacterium]|nr:hypothetical protein [Tepidanaerobacteraceae bacterium]